MLGSDVVYLAAQLAALFVIPLSAIGILLSVHAPAPSLERVRERSCRSTNR